MGREIDISINVNRDANDNLCRHLIEIKKRSPSTSASTNSILHTMEISQRQWKSWEIALMASSRTKGCRLKHTRMGQNFVLISLLYKILLLQCFTIAQYIAPQQEMKGRIRAFPSIWKAKDQFIHFLMRKTPNIFYF